MGIKLNVEVETPLSDDDRDILAGISVMTLATANRQDLADQSHMQQEEGEMDPPPCGAQRDDGHSCTPASVSMGTRVATSTGRSASTGC